MYVYIYTFFTFLFNVHIPLLNRRGVSLSSPRLRSASAIYICTYIHIYICIYIDIDIDIHIHIHIYLYICIHLLIYLSIVIYSLPEQVRRLTQQSEAAERQRKSTQARLSEALAHIYIYIYIIYLSFHPNRFGVSPSNPKRQSASANRRRPASRKRSLGWLGSTRPAPPHARPTARASCSCCATPTL